MLRDAQFALDTMINGYWSQERGYRFGGIIDANDVVITIGNNNESDIISLFDTSNTLYGRFVTVNDANHSVIYFDNDGVLNGNERAIIDYSHTSPKGGVLSPDAFYQIITKYNEIEEGNYPSVVHLVNVKLAIRRIPAKDSLASPVSVGVESSINLRR